VRSVAAKIRLMAFLALLAGSIVMPSGRAETQVPELPARLRIGVYDNPPKIGITDEGKAYGFHIDLIESILEGSGASPEYITGSWDESLNRLEKGDINVMPDIAWSEERAARFAFNSESALLNWAVVYAGRGQSIQTILDLSGKRVAVFGASIHTTGEHGIMRMAADYNIGMVFLSMDSYEACFDAVRRGDADAAVVNRLFGLLNENTADIVRTPIIFNPSQVLYAFNKDSTLTPSLVALFDSRLATLKADPDSAYYKAFNDHLKPQIAKERRQPRWMGIVLISAIGLVLILALVLFFTRTEHSDHRRMQKFFGTHRTMGDIKAEIVDRAMLGYAAFSIPLILIVAYRAFFISGTTHELLYLPAFAVPLFAAIAGRRLGGTAKILMLIFFLFVLGALMLAAGGGRGMGYSYFFTAGILATMLFGRRWGLTAFVCGLAISVSSEFLAPGGAELSPARGADLLSPSSWLFTTISYFMLFFTLLGGLQKFYGRLFDSVENLEQRIAERTKDLDAANRNLKTEIVEHERTEKELESAKAEAEKANATRSRFFATISHEIRTPLNAILGYSQVLLRSMSPGSEQQREVETIKSSGEHLLGIINEVLDMSRIEQGKAERIVGICDLYVLLEDVERMFAESVARKGLGFSIEAAPGLPRRILTDGAKLKQVLINLASNAVKFSDAGEIRLSLSDASLEGAPRIAFSVSDMGAGIPPEHIGKIFDPFEQTETGKSRGGTGLGLSISKEYCRILGGELQVESTAGKGSRFFFSIEAPAVGLETGTKEEGTENAFLPQFALAAHASHASRAEQLPGDMQDPAAGWAALPASVSQNLHNAVLAGDLVEVADLAQSISRTHPELSRIISKLADDVAIDRLLAMSERAARIEASKATAANRTPA
jgi:signal transduction histidine kinase/ABC-type amino acid transport substrate-binding protein